MLFPFFCSFPDNKKTPSMEVHSMAFAVVCSFLKVKQKAQ
nr:MAG TPA: hypothetical protein [Caudoviricetes sp.]